MEALVELIVKEIKGHLLFQGIHRLAKVNNYQLSKVNSSFRPPALVYQSFPPLPKSEDG